MRLGWFRLATAAGDLAAAGALWFLALAGQVLQSSISMDSGAVMPQNLLMDGIVQGGSMGLGGYFL